MRIVRGYPPNYPEIRARLRPGPRTIFAYGDTIFDPTGSPISADLLAHEQTHLEQQRKAGGADAWWRRYIDEPSFRLEQEVEAYRAQVEAAAALPRSARRDLLARVTRDLASPMYGRLVTKKQALALLG